MFSYVLPCSVNMGEHGWTPMFSEHWWTPVFTMFSEHQCSGRAAWLYIPTEIFFDQSCTQNKSLSKWSLARSWYGFSRTDRSLKKFCSLSFVDCRLSIVACRLLLGPVAQTPISYWFVSQTREHRFLSIFMGCQSNREQRLSSILWVCHLSQWTSIFIDFMGLSVKPVNIDFHRFLSIFTDFYGFVSKNPGHQFLSIFINFYQFLLKNW